jgi:hypothetical protein
VRGRKLDFPMFTACTVRYNTVRTAAARIHVIGLLPRLHNFRHLTIAISCVRILRRKYFL